MNESAEKADDWRDGRRIVELGLADELRACKTCACGKPLHLFRVYREQRYGYGRFLYVKCDCGAIKKVTTGKRHQTSKYGMAFDVNTKAAVGMSVSLSLSLPLSLSLSCFTPQL